MGIKDWFKGKNAPAQNEKQEDSRDAIINENRERANRIMNALKLIRQKLDVEMIVEDENAKQECITRIAKLEKELSFSPANEQKDASLIDAEIKSCLDIMLKAVKQNAVPAVQNSVECIDEAVKVRPVPDDQNIRKIKMYVSKAKMSLEMMLTQSIIEYRKQVCADAEARKEAISESIKQESAKGADVMALMPKYDDIKQLDAKIKDYKNDIELREKMLSDLKDSIDQINMSVRNESILSQEELSEIYQLIDSASTEDLIDLKGKFEIIQEHKDYTTSVAKQKEEILMGLRTTTYATLQNTITHEQAAQQAVKEEAKTEAAPVQAEQPQAQNAEADAIAAIM